MINLLFFPFHFELIENTFFTLSVSLSPLNFIYRRHCLCVEAIKWDKTKLNDAKRCRIHFQAYTQHDNDLLMVFFNKFIYLSFVRRTHSRKHPLIQPIFPRANINCWNQTFQAVHPFRNIPAKNIENSSILNERTSDHICSYSFITSLLFVKNTRASAACHKTWKRS